MTVYVFGNPDDSKDRRAFETANFLKSKVPGIEFCAVAPNEDVPFSENAVIMDVVEGLKEVRVLEDIDKIKITPRGSVHDFDLGFQLKYLKKIGLLKKVIIIGLPMEGEIDYDRVQSILRKLVAQDIHGS